MRQDSLNTQIVWLIGWNAIMIILDRQLLLSSLRPPSKLSSRQVIRWRASKYLQQALTMANTEKRRIHQRFKNRQRLWRNFSRVSGASRIRRFRVHTLLRYEISVWWSSHNLSSRNASRSNVDSGSGLQNILSISGTHQLLRPSWYSLWKPFVSNHLPLWRSISLGQFVHDLLTCMGLLGWQDRF
jgi:hypothetical protein